MKKILVLILFYLLIIGNICNAQTDSVTLEGNAILNWASDTLAYKPNNSVYYMVIDSYGNPLTSLIYTDLYPHSTTGLYRATVESVDGLHGNGILDPYGKVLVPPEYLKTEIISDRWQIGITGIMAEAEESDYKAYDNNNNQIFYRIVSLDFYFDGKFAGKLERSQYDPNTAIAYGSYIYMRDRGGNRYFYNSNMEKSPYISAQGSSREYDEVYDSKTGLSHFFHQGTGQEAFVPECTLTADEVNNPYLYNRGVLYDLQGNEIFKTERVYDRVGEFKNGYAEVKIGKLYGMIDETGKEIIPVEYDSFSYTDYPFYQGYIGAVKNGKFGFLDNNGNVTCDFIYSESNVKDYYTMATIVNLNGKIIILSAEADELPTQYDEIELNRMYDTLAFVAVNSDGQKSLIDINGETILPWGNYYSIELNHASTVAYVKQRDVIREFQIIHLNLQDTDVNAAGQL